MKKTVTRIFSIAMMLAISISAIFTMPISAATGDRLVGPQINDEDPIMMAYYRTWRDAEMPNDSNSNLPDENVIRMTDIPADIDIVSVFHYVKPGTDQEDFWNTLRDEYVPTLHARGQRLVRTLDYSVLLKIQDETGKDGGTLTEEDYSAFAEDLIAEYVTPWNLDGLDVDMETYLNDNQVTVISNVFKELSKQLGINEGSDNLLIYDTNQDNHKLFEEIAPYISYLFIQAYGRSPSRLDTTWDTYKEDISSTQVLFGVSFHEEQDQTRWADFEGDTWEDTRAYQYATWQPEGGEKGGAFIYGIDRDGKEFGDESITETDFAWTNLFIKELKKAALPKPSEAAKEVANQLATLPTKGNITLEDKEAIEAGRTAYDALPSGSQSLVVDYAVRRLTNAEAELVILEDSGLAAAKPVADQLATLPIKGKVQLKDREAIEAGRTAYNELTDTEQDILTDNWGYTVNRLLNAETELEKLEK